MAPPEADVQNNAYLETARVMYSIQDTLDGSEPVVALEDDNDLTSRAKQWAQAEVLHNPTAEMVSDLDGWRGLDEEMKATAEIRKAQLKRRNDKVELWNERYAEIFNSCTESSEECQRKAKDYADNGEVVIAPNENSAPE